MYQVGSIEDPGDKSKCYQVERNKQLYIQSKHKIITYKQYLGR